jgi:hypothetical protein
MKKSFVAGEPKPKSPCPLRSKVIDELWARYGHTGNHKPPPAPAPVATVATASILRRATT